MPLASGNFEESKEVESLLEQERLIDLEVRQEMEKFKLSSNKKSSSEKSEENKSQPNNFDEEEEELNDEKEGQEYI